MTHAFATKLRQGEAVERDLDEHFSESYSIRKASMDEQRSGIDRVFTDKESGEMFRVEYKADWRAQETGNVFIETISVDTAAKRGWVYTSRAEWLVYALPQASKFFLVLFGELRAKLPEWRERYPEGKAQNKSYTTHGVLVPLAEFSRLAHCADTYSRTVE